MSIQNWDDSEKCLLVFQRWMRNSCIGRLWHKFQLCFCLLHHSGSTNDSIAWGDSNLHHMLEINCLLCLLPDKYCLLEMNHFQIPKRNLVLSYFIYLFAWSTFLLWFLSGCWLDNHNDYLNYRLSHSHQAVEQASGILTQDGEYSGEALDSTLADGHGVHEAA